MSHQHAFLGTKVRGGPIFFYLRWEVFFNKREYSEADCPDLLITKLDTNKKNRYAALVMGAGLYPAAILPISNH